MRLFYVRHQEDPPEHYRLTTSDPLAVGELLQQWLREGGHRLEQLEEWEIRNPLNQNRRITPSWFVQQWRESQPLLRKESEE